MKKGKRKKTRLKNARSYMQSVCHCSSALKPTQKFVHGVQKNKKQVKLITRQHSTSSHARTTPTQVCDTQTPTRIQWPAGSQLSFHMCLAPRGRTNPKAKRRGPAQRCSAHKRPLNNALWNLGYYRAVTHLFPFR
jgi:hypothetical protein